MSLIDDVKNACDRLAPRGWHALLCSVTDNDFSISQQTPEGFLTELSKPLPSIDRERAGFEDFHPTANQGVTKGRPAHSLLFHALASPNVHPTPDGKPSNNPGDYPTLDELEDLENFIYSLVSNRTDLDDTLVAVFAYQYRVANRTTHLRHADMTYSRTGIARVGTERENYDRSRRSFWVHPKSGNTAMSVLPARYGAFLARRAKPGAAGSVQGGHDGRTDHDYVFPVHKLFSGRECLNGRDLCVGFSEFHRNEKLQMLHRLPLSEGGLPIASGFDISKSPYVRDSSNGGNLASLKHVGSSVLVLPKPSATLVRTVAQRNSVTNTKQLAHFKVPSVRTIRGRRTRYAVSTLEIPTFDTIPPSNLGDRLAPEYANIRHSIDPAGPITQTPDDLNLLAEPKFREAMEKGGHYAAHFTDDCCDGCVETVVTGLDRDRENILAFSLITAPDFFPLADQIEVNTDPTIRRAEPLSKGRLPVNPSLPRPSAPTTNAFDRSDRTITAVVGNNAFGPNDPIPRHPNRMVSFFPDAASNVFAPGWDSSRSRDSLTPSGFLTSSGLGSPFPEDAKLCAALSSFWPAVAPDNGRTFGNEESRFGNQLPMLDDELGFHSNHERVRSGELRSYHGWDGEFGPFFEEVDGKPYVNFCAIERSDYVTHALAGRIKVSLTAEVQSRELIARNEALEACLAIPSIRDLEQPCLVVFRKIDNWVTFGRGRPELTGGGYLLEFAELRGGRERNSELNRVRKEVKRRHTCQLGRSRIAYKKGKAKFRLFDHNGTEI